MMTPSLRLRQKHPPPATSRPPSSRGGPSPPPGRRSFISPFSCLPKPAGPLPNQKSPMRSSVFRASSRTYGILIQKPRLQRSTRLSREVGPRLQQSIHSSEARTAQYGMVAKIVVLPRISYIGNQNRPELFSQLPVVCKNGSKGLRNSPAYISRLFVHMPHKTPHDVPGLLPAFSRHAGHRAPQGLCSAVTHRELREAGRRTTDPSAHVEKSHPVPQCALPNPRTPVQSSDSSSDSETVTCLLLAADPAGLHRFRRTQKMPKPFSQWPGMAFDALPIRSAGCFSFRTGIQHSDRQENALQILSVRPPDLTRPDRSAIPFRSDVLKESIFMKRTYQPSKIKRARTHGFRERMSTASARAHHRRRRARAETISRLTRPRRHRLLRRSDFTLCYDKGRRFYSKHFVMFVLFSCTQ